MYMSESGQQAIGKNINIHFSILYHQVIKHLHVSKNSIYAHRNHICSWTIFQKVF